MSSITQMESYFQTLQETEQENGNMKTNRDGEICMADVETAMGKAMQEDETSPKLYWRKGMHMRTQRQAKHM
jgi:hypothetical protein